MPAPDYEYPETAPVAWRVITRSADYTVICTQRELMQFQMQYIQKQREKGIRLEDIKFVWDRTYIVPLTGVR